jgi:Predicted membrane protein (DUF2079)
VRDPGDRRVSNYDRPVVGRFVRDGAALVLYAAVAFSYFGVRLLPHPGRVVVGHGPDPGTWIWSFAWWPHAIGSWTNPFFTHAVYAPQGIDLAWTTTVPGLALPFAPLTLAFGSVVTFNVAAVLLPAAAAWTAYLLCRHVTGSTWASLIGGYLFGFSSFVLGQQLLGHIHMTGCFLMPLFALSVLRYLEGELDKRGASWRLALLLAWQLLISTEMTAMVTFALIVGSVLAFAFAPSLRPRLRSFLAPAIAAYATAAVIDGPFVFYLLHGFHSGSFANAVNARTDLANVLFPTETNGLAGGSFKSVSRSFDSVEYGLYLGVPILLVVVLYAWRMWRSPGARVLLWTLAVAFVLSLGVALDVGGHRIVSMPWALTRHVPVLDNIRADRFAIFVELIAAVIVALWTSQTKGRVFARPYVLPVLTVALLVPNVALAGYRSALRQYPFFASGAYRSCIQQGNTIAVFPIGQADPVEQTDAMRWQADSGFRFRLAAGYLYLYGPGDRPLSAFDDDPIVSYLHYWPDRGRPTMNTLLAFMANHGVSRVVTVEPADYPTASQMRRFGPVEDAGGLLIAPACDRPSLLSRNLTPYAQHYAAHWNTAIGFCAGANFVLLPYGLYPVGVFAGATHALVVQGKGLQCSAPAGYHRHGFATPAMGVPAHTYPYYAP